MCYLKYKKIALKFDTDTRKERKPRCFLDFQSWKEKKITPGIILYQMRKFRLIKKTDKYNDKKVKNISVISEFSRKEKLEYKVKTDKEIVT